MSTGREERIAITEAAFRIANDRMAAWDEASPDAPELYFCECAKLDCRARIWLTRDEYEAVRARSDRFVIALGHEVPDVEAVVQTHPGYAVIEKPDAVRPILEVSDPRTPEDGAGREEAELLAGEIAAEEPSQG